MAACENCALVPDGMCSKHVVELAGQIENLEQLWSVTRAVINRLYGYGPSIAKRKAERFLRGRLRHPELGGNPQAAPKLITAPGPRAKPPYIRKCVCAANEYGHQHDEMTGECLVCECDGFTPIPETAGYRHARVIE